LKQRTRGEAAHWESTNPNGVITDKEVERELPKTPKYITNDVQLTEQSQSTPKQENNRKGRIDGRKWLRIPGGEPELTSFSNFFESFFFFTSRKSNQCMPRFFHGRLLWSSF